MNGSWSDADRLRNLVRSLESQRGPDDGSRGELLATLHRIVLGTAVPADRTVDALVDVVSDSSLGDRTLDEADPDAAPDPSEVASVLDRLDVLEDRLPAETVADDPVQAWSRELRRLLDSRPAAQVTDVLAACGVDAGQLAQLTERVARAIVEALGEDWTASGFAGLFHAAMHTREPGPEPALRLCGLAGADAVDREAVRVRLESPVDALPVVRGRDRTVARLAAAVRNPPVRTQVLVGPAGYGKTTVALAVARRVRGTRMLALYVRAETLDELVDGLTLAAVRTGATVAQVDAAQDGGGGRRARRLWALLDRSPTPWVIVLDAAGPDAVGHPAWTHRSRTGAVLVTSQFGDAGSWGDAVRTHRIGEVPPEAGGQIVLDRIDDRPDLVARAARDHAQLLARRLDGVPLALSSAGRLVAAGVPGAGSLQEMAREVAQLRADNPLTAIYEIGVRSSPDGRLRELIRLIACFAPNQPLPVSVLDAGAVPRLVGTGLVEERLARGGEHTITIHPALAERSRRDRATVDAALADAHAIGLLRRELDRLDPGLLASRPRVRMLEPHVAELLASPALGEGALRTAALELADATASALVRCGHEATARAMLEQALAVAGTRDDAVALALRHTRAWLTALDGGDFATAERELVDVLAQRTARLGGRDPDTLSTRDCLAWVTAERGLSVEAREEIVAVLAARTEVLGLADPDTLATRHRLAWVTARLGRPHEVLGELTEVLRLRRWMLGADHLDVASTRYRLAWTLAKATRFAESEEAFRALQDDLEATAGWRHPLTMIVRVRVGWVLLKRLRLAEAEEHLRDVLADQVAVLGADHRRVLRTRHLLASVALQRGSMPVAVRGFTDVVRRRTELLGSDHPDTVDSRSQLAWTWLQTGCVEAADRAFQAIVADRTRTLGPANPDTLKVRCLTARARMMRGRLAEAQLLLRRLIEDASVALPADHRILLDVRHTLAVVNGLRGRSATAEYELRALLDDRTRLLGPEHRETLATRDYLAWILGRQGALGEAFEHAAAALADRTRLLGPEHLHTLTSRYRTAWLTQRDGRRAEAAEQFDGLCDDLRAVLGPEHPDTLRCRHALARLRRTAGDRPGAVAAITGVHRDQVRVQGPDAVDTLRAGEELGLALEAIPERRAEAERVLAEVLARREAVLEHDHPDTVRLRARLRPW